MHNSFQPGTLYINDFHQLNSTAAQREVRLMSLRPYSRQQKLEQIHSIKNQSRTSKENANMQRSKKA